jgi:excisionase family DNA binding protein
LKTKRLEITVETYERLIIKSTGRREIPCAECGRVVQMLKPDEATVLLGIRVRTIYRWVESGRLHFMEWPDGSLLICLNSLLHIR